MNQQATADNTVYNFQSDQIDGFNSLVELALDLRWSWSHATDEVWRQLDSSLWEVTHNPWAVLQTVSKEQIEYVLSNLALRKKIDQLLSESQRAISEPAWFQKNHTNSSLTCAAYFSMEFMLSEALPIYSGGLGNVAGDQMKAASDLGVPVVGVGLLYQQGYFRQMINKNGEQQALFPYNDPGQLPIKPLRQSNGQWLRLEIALPGYSVWLRAWEVQVGRNKLYLLDSNDPANSPVHRGITSELYGGGPELRLQQEILLGIGGWRLLHALGLKPEVCHLNEGHAALAVLERARCLKEETGESFELALTITRVGNLFTTHTAVPAGFDRFSPDLVEQYLGQYASQKLGITIHDLLALGRENPCDETEKFNMAYLALRGTGQVNGVSRLHGEVSRKIFEHIFPGWSEKEVPIGYVTNGVHTPTWDSASADDLWTEACGKDRWLGMNDDLETNIRRVSDKRLWQFRCMGRKSLVDYTRDRLAKQLAAAGDSEDAIEKANHIFDANILTLGFARRFATYKRPNLLLHDPERLLRILSNRKHPVQLIIAGKAHPQDEAGQALIQEWIKFIRLPQSRDHVIFLSDDDMFLTQRLVEGVDVWINTPRRPWEACGTSGMKVLVNGGINLSELDGWWAEAYMPELGWALGDGKEHGDNPAWDAEEADALYCLLEQQVVPQFYQRDRHSIPNAWVARMRESMARLTPQFSSNRAVREYTEQHYMRAAKAYLSRAMNNGAIGREVCNWKSAVGTHWNSLNFGPMRVETKDSEHMFEVEVCLGGFDLDAVRVQLYADDINGGAPLCIEMNIAQLQSCSPGYCTYRATASSERPANDYTPRIIPHHPEVAVPLECSRILWQR
jgi:starch phosphorylase